MTYLSWIGTYLGLIVLLYCLLTDGFHHYRRHFLLIHGLIEIPILGTVHPPLNHHDHCLSVLHPYPIGKSAAQGTCLVRLTGWLLQRSQLAKARIP